MKLTLETLEGRETPSVNVFTGIEVPNNGEPLVVSRMIIGDGTLGINLSKPLPGHGEFNNIEVHL